MSDFTLEKQPNPSGVGKPTSGTYGEGVALENLKRQLPVSDENAPALQPTPTSFPPPPQPYGGTGLPPAMFRPTQRPDVPVSSPIAQPPVNPVATAQPGMMRRLAMLDVLASSPDVSAATREWAQVVRDKLIESSAR